MAHKSNGDYNLDDFDFDDFDLDGFGDYNSMNKPMGRKAVTEIGGSFLSGIGTGLMSPENQKKIISKGLPEGYSLGYDAITEGTLTFSEVLYSFEIQNWYSNNLYIM